MDNLRAKQIVLLYFYIIPKALLNLKDSELRADVKVGPWKFMGVLIFAEFAGDMSAV